MLWRTARLVSLLILGFYLLVDADILQLTSRKFVKRENHTLQAANTTTPAQSVRSCISQCILYLGVHCFSCSFSPADQTCNMSTLPVRRCGEGEAGDCGGGGKTTTTSIVYSVKYPCKAGLGGGCGNKFCSDGELEAVCSCDGFSSTRISLVPLIRDEVTASSSSLRDPVQYQPEKVIDGLFNPSMHGSASDKQYTAITARELSPWIQLDLKSSYCIGGVKIWDRSEALRQDINDRLANVRVTIRDNPAEFESPPPAVICDYLPGQPPADVFVVECGRRMFGQFIRLTAVEINKKLNIYELEVLGWLRDKIHE